MIKMIAFDFDGTIADTLPMCIEIFKKSVSPYAGHELSESEIMQTSGLNEKGMIKSIINDNWEPALNDFYINYEKMHEICNKPFPGISDLITFLKEKNIIVSLITGKGKKTCYTSLCKLNMKNCFEDILTGNEKYRNKSDSIKSLLKKHSVKNNEFYYIGDAVSDVKACIQSNVTCLSAAWADNCDIQSLNDINPNLTFYSVIDLKKYLEKELAHNK